MEIFEISKIVKWVDKIITSEKLVFYCTRVFENIKNYELYERIHTLVIPFSSNT